MAGKGDCGRDDRGRCSGRHLFQPAGRRRPHECSDRNSRQHGEYVPDPLFQRRDRRRRPFRGRATQGICCAAGYVAETLDPVSRLGRRTQAHHRSTISRVHSDFRNERSPLLSIQGRLGFASTASQSATARTFISRSISAWRPVGPVTAQNCAIHVPLSAWARAGDVRRGVAASGGSTGGP